MGKVLAGITDDVRSFMEAQPLFFVATAPLARDGHVNLSPKGLDTFAVVSPTRVAYLDLTGSGNETAAHLLENSRITFMFCSFAGPPRILRLYGRGRACLPEDAEWPALRGRFGDLPGVRQIIVADIQRVQQSCGFGVPLMEQRGQRDTLLRWAEAKGTDGIVEYRAQKNVRSIDGLPTPVSSSRSSGIHGGAR
jgi:hypothetical protein